MNVCVYQLCRVVDGCHNCFYLQRSPVYMQTAIALAQLHVVLVCYVVMSVGMLCCYECWYVVCYECWCVVMSVGVMCCYEC